MAIVNPTKDGIYGRVTDCCHRFPMAVRIWSKCNSGWNIKVKTFIYATVTLCNSFKVSQTTSFPVLQKKKVAAPFFEKRKFWMDIKSKIWPVLSVDWPLFQPLVNSKLLEISILYQTSSESIVQLKHSCLTISRKNDILVYIGKVHCHPFQYTPGVFSQAVCYLSLLVLWMLCSECFVHYIFIVFDNVAHFLFNWPMQCCYAVKCSCRKLKWCWCWDFRFNFVEVFLINFCILINFHLAGQ